jgi:hypothetical protein
MERGNLLLPVLAEGLSLCIGRLRRYRLAAMLSHEVRGR